MNLEDTIAFAEARETDRQDAKSLGGRQIICWRCGEEEWPYAEGHQKDFL